jgi:hypothetical protein
MTTLSLQEVSWKYLAICAMYRGLLVSQCGLTCELHGAQPDQPATRTAIAVDALVPPWTMEPSPT